MAKRRTVLVSLSILVLIAPRGLAFHSPIPQVYNGLRPTRGRALASTKEPPTREPPTREPAGVESLFSIRSAAYKQRRERQKARKESRSKRWPWQRRNKQDGASKEHDIWGGDVEQTQKELSLPCWACVDVEEERRVAAMKLLLKNDLLALQDKTIKRKDGRKVKVVEAFPDVYGDLRILRFLRKDKKQDPVSASVRYRKFLNWRRDHDVDEIRIKVQEKPFCPPAHLDIVSDYIPCDFDFWDHSKDDMVPALLHVSDWDTAGITNLMRQKKLSLEDFLQYWTYIYETIHWKLYGETLKRKKMVYIDEVCDLTHLSMRQFAPGFASRVIKPWIYLTQRNYPETAKHIVFLNPPRILSLAWNLVAPFISPSTIDKIRMHPGFDGDCHDFIHDTEINRDELASIHAVKSLK